MSANITVKLNRAHLTARFRAGKEGAGPILARNILDDCNQYAVPDDGEHLLKSSGRTSQDSGGFLVIWDAVHAAYQFYGMWPDGSHVIRHHTHGYTTAPSIMWTESTSAAKGKNWERVFRQEYIRAAGG